MIIHVHPINDSKEHILDDTKKCWCKPTIKKIGDGYRVSHNSHDEREFVEQNLNELLADDKSWDLTVVGGLDPA